MISPRFVSASLSPCRMHRPEYFWWSPSPLVHVPRTRPPSTRVTHWSDFGLVWALFNYTFKFIHLACSIYDTQCTNSVGGRPVRVSFEHEGKRVSVRLKTRTNIAWLRPWFTQQLLFNGRHFHIALMGNASLFKSCAPIQRWTMAICESEGGRMRYTVSMSVRHRQVVD